MQLTFTDQLAIALIVLNSFTHAPEFLQATHEQVMAQLERGCEASFGIKFTVDRYRQTSQARTSRLLRLFAVLAKDS